MSCQQIIMKRTRSSKGMSAALGRLLVGSCQSPFVVLILLRITSTQAIRLGANERIPLTTFTVPCALSCRLKHRSLDQATFALHVHGANHASRPLRTAEIVQRVEEGCAGQVPVLFWRPAAPRKARPLHRPTRADAAPSRRLCGPIDAAGRDDQQPRARCARQLVHERHASV